MVTFIEKLNMLWEFILTSLTNNFGLTSMQASILFRVVIGYIIVFIVVLKIHRGINGSYKKLMEHVVYVYDGIWYTLSHFVYHNPQIQDQYAIHWGLFQLLFEEKKDYLTHKKRILEGVKMLEEDTNTTIIEKKQRIYLKKLHMQMSIKQVFDVLFGRFLTVITLGIYKLFW